MQTRMDLHRITMVLAALAEATSEELEANPDRGIHLSYRLGEQEAALETAKAIYAETYPEG